ncbi:hypothetical protein U9I19_000024 [Bacillus phage KKP_4049]
MTFSTGYTLKKKGCFRKVCCYIKIFSHIFENDSKISIDTNKNKIRSELQWL